jgi:hypothetical protein
MTSLWFASYRACYNDIGTYNVSLFQIGHWTGWDVASPVKVQVHKLQQIQWDVSSELYRYNIY